MLLGTLSGQPPAVTSWPPAGQPRSTPSQPLIAAAVADSVPHQSTASGGNPAPSKPVAPPLILPCTGLLGIPQALVRKITEGRYIDLGDLLPEALEWAFDRSAEDKAPDKDKSRKFPVANITDWVLAFATFMAVSVHFDPSRARPLATYMSIVARLAREVPGQVWQRYDRLFPPGRRGEPGSGLGSPRAGYLAGCHRGTSPPHPVILWGKPHPGS